MSDFDDKMDDLKDTIEDLIEDLRQERDELRVKVGLAKLEAREEWQDIETKLGHLEAKARQVGGATAEASKDIGAAARLLGEEIRKGLRSVASRF